ncbi:hypothetical protein [Nitrospira sp. M1]
MRKMEKCRLSKCLGLILVCGFLAYPMISFAEGQTVDDRLQRLERQLEELRKQTDQSRTLDVSTVDQRLEKLESRQSPGGNDDSGNMVFFRGGRSWATSDRGSEVFTDVAGSTGRNDGNKGYYLGAGLDLVLSKNVFGMMSKTWVLGEIGVEYKRWHSKRVRSATNVLAGTGISPTKIELSQLTVSVSPKVMFMEDSRFRPWIIPIGLDFHVISPPSGDVTVLDIGAQFAVGAQYRVWRAFHIGVDGRFHLAAGETNTTNNFGTVGGYVGIAF